MRVLIRLKAMSLPVEYEGDSIELVHSVSGLCHLHVDGKPVLSFYAQNLEWLEWK